MYQYSCARDAKFEYQSQKKNNPIALYPYKAIFHRKKNQTKKIVLITLCLPILYPAQMPTHPAFSNSQTRQKIQSKRLQNNQVRMHRDTHYFPRAVWLKAEIKRANRRINRKTQRGKPTPKFPVREPIIKTTCTRPVIASNWRNRRAGGAFLFIYLFSFFSLFLANRLGMGFHEFLPRYTAIVSGVARIFDEELYRGAQRAVTRSLSLDVAAGSLEPWCSVRGGVARVRTFAESWVIRSFCAFGVCGVFLPFCRPHAGKLCDACTI